MAASPEKSDSDVVLEVTPLAPDLKKENDGAVSGEESAKAANDANRSLTFRRLIQQSKPERRMLAVGITCSFFAGITRLAIPVFVGTIIDAVTATDAADLEGPVGWLCDNMSVWDCGRRRQLLELAIVAICVAGLLSSLFNFGQWSVLQVAGERVVARLRKRLFGAILEQEVAMFDTTKTGELVNRLSADTNEIKEATTTQVAESISAVMNGLLGVVYVVALSWDLTLVMLSVVPLLVLTSKCYGNYYRRLAKANQDVLAEASDVAEESIANVRVVKSFSKEQAQKQLYGEHVDVTFLHGKKMAYALGGYILWITMLFYVVVALVLWYGATKVLDGKMTSGALSTYLLVTVQIGFSLSRVVTLLSTFFKAMGAGERVFQLFDRKPAIPGRGGCTPAEFTGTVAVQQVEFAYPSRKEMPVLRELSLDLEPGKVVALVGPSGGGKTTVVQLLMRFYDPDQGDITVDGRPLRDFDLQWLHEKIGYVSQEPVLFARSILDNIKFGVHREVTEEEVVAAATKANAHQFISQFPDGYETMVGERGVRLSGGQKQRVAISRAILMDPKILLLDEATSALDSESEHLVQEALDRMMYNRAVLVIAHRLSTVQNADEVLVMDHGKVAERGRHAELLQRGGVYAKLVRRQLMRQARDHEQEQV